MNMLRLQFVEASKYNTLYPFVTEKCGVYEQKPTII